MLCRWVLRSRPLLLAWHSRLGECELGVGTGWSRSGRRVSFILVQVLVHAKLEQDCKRAGRGGAGGLEEPGPRGTRQGRLGLTVDLAGSRPVSGGSASRFGGPSASGSWTFCPRASMGPARVRAVALAWMYPASVPRASRGGREPPQWLAGCRPHVAATSRESWFVFFSKQLLLSGDLLSHPCLLYRTNF